MCVIKLPSHTMHQRLTIVLKVVRSKQDNSSRIHVVLWNKVLELSCNLESTRSLNDADCPSNNFETDLWSHLHCFFCHHESSCICFKMEEQWASIVNNEAGKVFSPLPKTVSSLPFRIMDIPMTYLTLPLQVKSETPLETNHSRKGTTWDKVSLSNNSLKIF